jgi:DNA replication protein DnaC
MKKISESMTKEDVERMHEQVERMRDAQRAQMIRMGDLSPTGKDAAERETVSYEKRELITNVGIPQMYRSFDFDSFHCLPGLSADSAKNAVQRYVKNAQAVVEKGSNLILSGGAGTGKTMLAAIAGIEFAVKGYSVKFIRLGNFFREIKRAWNSDAAYERRKADELIDSACKADLLIIDDAGIMHGSDAEKNIIIEIISSRYEKFKPVVVTSNVPCHSSDKNAISLDKLLGAMTVDRLLDNKRESKQLIFTWESYRKGKAA